MSSDQPQTTDDRAWAICPILLALDQCDMPEIVNGPRPECHRCRDGERGTPGCLLVARIVIREADRQ